MPEVRVLDSIVRETVDSYAVPAGKVDFKSGAQDAEAKVDVKMLQDALIRLMDNAFEAQGGKGP